MRRLITLLTVAIMAVSATPVLAQISAQFDVSGHLGLAATTAGCTTHTYTAVCPAADSCSCYKLSKASLHSANLPFGLTIPPGTTRAFLAVDGKDGTGSGGTCKPVYGEIDYAANSGPDTVQIFLFGTLCNPFSS